MERRRLEKILAGFRKQRVLVVGDYFLDGYWEVDKTKSELALETPWHVNPVVEQRYYPGAAGTVVNNLCALGTGRVHCVGVIGNDAFADVLVQKLTEQGADPDGLVKSSSSITPIYLKIMHHGLGETVMEGPRFDFENRQPMSNENQAAVLERTRRLVPEVDSVVIIEHLPTENFGVITNEVRDNLLALAGKHEDIIFYADSRTRIGLYKNLIIKPNRFEAKKAVDPAWNGSEVDVEEARRCAVELAARTGKPVYVTLGGNGILVADGESVDHVPGIMVHGEKDIVGAGDSVTAGIVLGLSAGANAVEAGTIGNLVGSITITKIGVTGTATQDEVLERFDESRA